MFTQQLFTCSKLTVETLVKGVKYVKSQEQRHCRQLRRPVVFNVKFEHIPHFFLMFLLFTLSKYLYAEFQIMVNTELEDFEETVEVIDLSFSTCIRRVSWTPAKLRDDELCNKS